MTQKQKQEKKKSETEQNQQQIIQVFHKPETTHKAKHTDEIDQINQIDQTITTNSSIPLIRIEALSKTYKNGEIMVKALNHIDLTIEKGEFVAIMGASGSGKSTLMNILGFLDRPTEGNYYLEGMDVKNKTDNELSFIRNQKIGFVFQSFNLIPRTSALKNIELPMIYGKINSEERKKRAALLLESVGLGSRGEHMPNELSGGQKQRVAIARALANQPPIILADEPTGNLDSHSSVEIMEIFKNLNRKEGNTVIIVTHELDIAQYTDRILTFKDGVIKSDVRSKKNGEIINKVSSGENGNTQIDATSMEGGGTNATV